MKTTEEKIKDFYARYINAGLGLETEITNYLIAELRKEVEFTLTFQTEVKMTLDGWGMVTFSQIYLDTEEDGSFQIMLHDEEMDIEWLFCNLTAGECYEIYHEFQLTKEYRTKQQSKL